jgi:hypothetical protein
MRTILTALFLFAITGSTAARADEPTVTATAQPAGVTGDPNVDRAFVLPTAMTQPAGTLTYNNYELLLHGLTYGITDRVQASVTILSPVSKEMPFFSIGSLKGRVLSAGAFHLALQGNLAYAHAFETSSNDNNIVSLGGGALASFCLRDDCASLVSGTAMYQVTFNGGDNQALFYGGSLVQRLGNHVKLLAELASGAQFGQGNGFDNAPGLLINYGVRLHGESVAADVGFIKPLSSDGDAGLLMGLPFVNVSYRW